MDAFDQLVVEKERTMFCFYGWFGLDGKRGEAPYFKQARSLSEALEDLHNNAGVDNANYYVEDLFVEVVDNGGVAVHVELVRADAD